MSVWKAKRRQEVVREREVSLTAVDEATGLELEVKQYTSRGTWYLYVLGRLAGVPIMAHDSGPTTMSEDEARARCVQMAADLAAAGVTPKAAP